MFSLAHDKRHASIKKNYGQNIQYMKYVNNLMQYFIKEKNEKKKFKTK